MNTRRLNSCQALTAGLLLSTLLYGPSCTPAPNAAEVASPPEATGELWVVDPEVYKQDMLSLQEKVTQSRREYMELDLQDASQYRFVLSRLALSGRNRENSPKLFQIVEALRQGQSKKDGQLQGEEADMFTHTNVDNGVDSDGVLTSTVATTIQEGTDYTYLDNAFYDEQGNAIGELAVKEQMGAGTYVQVAAQGVLPQAKSLQASPTECISSSSLLLIRRLTGTYYSTFSTVIKCANGTPTMNEPRDQDLPCVPLDGTITVCLDRSWLYDYYDCEYKMEGTEGRVKMPLKGSVEFGIPVKQSNGKPDVLTASYQLFMGESGGACKLGFDLTSYLTVDPASPSRILWNVPNADFGSQCFRHQERVRLMGNMTAWLNIGTTNKPNYIRGFAPLQPTVMPVMRFAYSCLAAGTQVQLPDGSEIAIDIMDRDDEVLSNARGDKLTVTDISVGVEEIPMVRLEDDFGHSLLATRSHPILTPHQGVRLADDLEEGDMVLTEFGPALLTRVEREMFHQPVYNLKLGNDRERQGLDMDGTTFYANGFLVGDGRMQARHARELKE